MGATRLGRNGNGSETTRVWGGGAKRLGLKREVKRLGGKRLGGKTSCYPTEWTALYFVLDIAKVQSGITKKIYIQELWFLRSAHRLSCLEFL